VQSLISAGSGLIGALIGFGGSMLVSIRAERSARNQTQYALAHERRDEALGTIYGMLDDLWNKFKQWADTPLDDEASLRRLRATARDAGELGRFHLKNIVWVPNNISKELNDFRSVYLSWLEKALQAGERELGAELPESEYDTIRKEAAEWVREEGSEKITRIMISIRGALGVNELDK
jgi:hypothetical protein